MSVSGQDAAELLADVQHRWSGEPATVLSAVTEGWPGMSEREPCPEDAETCRLAMLAAARVSAPQEAGVWRVRAATRFAAVQWPEGVAATLIPEFYFLLARANDFYASGAHLGVLRSSPEAQAVLDELRRVGAAGRRPYPFGPDGSLLMRLAVEKTGLLHLLDGDLDGARAFLREALVHASGDSRGALKVRAGLALVDHLTVRRRGGGPDEAAAATVALAGEPGAAAVTDIHRLLEQNAERMLAGREDLLLYEQL